jgi:hypothetical protein
MTTGAGLQGYSTWRKFVVLVAAVLGLLAGLCTVFALVVTMAQAWQEHAQAQWPEATAQVQQCALAVYTHKPKRYWIDCSISYVVRGQEIVSHVHSFSVRDPQRVIAQYPARQFERMQDWVDEHPQETSIKVHYDPANPRKAIVFEAGMPLGGPRTPDNLKLLGFFAASCVVLLAIARVARPRPSVGIGAS